MLIPSLVLPLFSLNVGPPLSSVTAPPAPPETDIAPPPAPPAPVVQDPDAPPAVKKPKKRAGKPDKPTSLWSRAMVHAPATLALLWPTLLMLGGYVGWHRWGRDEIGRRYYGLDPQSIQISDPPPHIRSDIVQGVYRDAGMDTISLMQPSAAAMIASAFATNPWIRQVNSVRKLPGGRVDVRLDYRVPVAVVDVISWDPAVEGLAMVPIDAFGTFLPTDEFWRPDNKDYLNDHLHIIAPGAHPTGAPGTAFGDERVEAAAILAAMLHPHRRMLRLQWIDVAGDPRREQPIRLEIADVVGGRWHWGSVPGRELAGERSANEKLQLLLDGVEPGTDLSAI